MARLAPPPVALCPCRRRVTRLVNRPRSVSRTTPPQPRQNPHVAGDAAYALVHLVAQQSFEELIEAQVLDPMVNQATTDGRNRPATTVVAFLEPARVAVGRRMRRRAKILSARAPQVRVTVLPYISRIGIGINSWFLARRIGKLTKGLPVVLHCRGEAAVEWASALARHLGQAAIVADIRGIWPDEMLMARGYERVSDADEQSRHDYHVAMDHLKTALREAHAVVAVSDALAGWVEELGVWRHEIGRVPCCVPSVRFSQAARDARRTALGLGDRIVLSYLGGMAPYQHIEDGLVPFVRIARQLNDRVHLLCITKDPESMKTLLERGGVPVESTTVIRVPQTQVSDYLCAADAGLLLRAPSEVNRVSMPVKVGEYLSCGVPLIVSRFSEWVDELIVKPSAGIAIDWFGVDPSLQAREVARVIGELERRGATLRTGALALCADRFLWSSYTGELRRTYVRALAVAKGG